MPKAWNQSAQSHLEDFLMTQNLAQMNFKPTHHQVGCKSSLLDSFISNIPGRITNVEKFLNTMSEHKGVKCTIHTKTQINTQKAGS